MKHLGSLCLFGFSLGLDLLVALAACRLSSNITSLIPTLPLVLTTTWLLRALGVSRFCCFLEELLAAPGGRVLHVQKYLGLNRLQKAVRWNHGE